MGVAQPCGNLRSQRRRITSTSSSDDFPALPPSRGAWGNRVVAVTFSSISRTATLVVPPGMYFMMGGQPAQQPGLALLGLRVPRANILGRPLFNYWVVSRPERDNLNKQGFGHKLAWIGHVLVPFLPRHALETHFPRCSLNRNCKIPI